MKLVVKHRKLHSASQSFQLLGTMTKMMAEILMGVSSKPLPTKKETATLVEDGHDSAKGPTGQM